MGLAAPVVMVAGAGIGGLTAALGLIRIGATVRVVERRARADALGAGIVLFPNALRALDALGVGAAVRAVGSRPSSTDDAGGLRLPSGRWVLRTDHRDDRQMLGFHRHELHAALLSALPDGVVSPATELSGLTPRPDGVEVTLRTGGRDDVVRVDLVIGADGVGSAVRSCLWPAVRPRYAGYTAWRAVTPPGIRRVHGGETWGRGRRFGTVPLGGGRVYWYATANTPEGGGGELSPAQRHADVVRRFGAWHDPVPRLLAATAPDDVLRHDVRWIDPPLGSYARGRVALLGDAAHAMTPDLGQGACQAIEDAAVLCAELAGHAPSVEAALRRYDAARRPRTQRVARTAARLGRIGQLEGRLSTALRTAVMRLLPPAAARAGSGWLLDWPCPQIPEGGAAG